MSDGSYDSEDDNKYTVADGDKDLSNTLAYQMTNTKRKV